MDGMGLNITIMSYRGVLYWGLAADARAVPRLWDIAAAIPHALTELMEAAGLRVRALRCAHPPRPGHAADGQLDPHRGRARRLTPTGPPDVWPFANWDISSFMCATSPAPPRSIGTCSGWRQIMPEPGDPPVGAAAFSSGRTHHELLLIEVGADATPIPAGRRVGMYHFGLNVGETDDDLRAMVATLQAAGTPIVGASDHTVTHSLYIEDPDGNEIELYVDVPGVDWKTNPSLIAAPIRPLKL